MLRSTIKVLCVLVFVTIRLAAAEDGTPNKLTADGSPLQGNKTSDQKAARPTAEAGKKAVPMRAELRVLEPMLGRWTTECVQKEGGHEKRITGSATVKLILDGRFIQFSGKRDQDHSESLQIIGFDPGKNEYRMSYFDSLGAIVESVIGRWDKDKKTLTWRVRRDDGVLMTNEERFLDNDTMEWHLVVKTAEGTVVSEQTGKSTRRK